jgi:hypothetical protein
MKILRTPSQEEINSFLDRCKEKMPEDWNLTIADLLEEVKAGKREPVGSPEIDWAREYERRQLPVGTRFPEKGDVYESLKGQSVDYLTAWAAPCTGGGKGTLKKGEQVWVTDDPSKIEKPIAIYVLPVEYEKLEERMVPKSERESPKYGGFYLYLTTIDLNTNFKLLKTKMERPTSGNSGLR